MRHSDGFPGAAFHNRFDITVTDAADGRIRSRARAFNTVCDTLWEQLSTDGTALSHGGDYFRYILLGSGSGYPYASDTALFSHEGGYPLRQENGRVFTYTYDRETRTAAVSGHIRLGTADAVGVTVTEVGIGYDEDHIVTHAMLEDMNGNPMSVTKTETDILDITATVFVHFPEDAESSGGYRVMLDGETEREDGGLPAGGLIAWLAGAYRDTGNSGAEGLPCRYLIPSSGEPEAVPFQSDALPADAVGARALSFSPEERIYRTAFRIPAEKGNFPGGIRYLTLYSLFGSDGEEEGQTLRPTIVFPYTGTGGRAPIAKDGQHVMTFDASVSLRGGTEDER